MTARCIRESGAATPPETLHWLRERWLPRLEPAREPHPYGRAAVGRALALPTPDGGMLDNRPGVGLRADGWPDIEWVKIEGGTFVIGGDAEAYDSLDEQTVTLDTFWMARYPITNAQWRAFLDDREGYQNERWWREAGVPQQEPSGATLERGQPPARDSQLVRGDGLLPVAERAPGPRRAPAHRGRMGARRTGKRWNVERSNVGTDGPHRGRFYPWGDEFISGYANIDETYEGKGPYYLQRTSPVGMYPQGATPEGLHEMSGNVWEWTLTDYDERTKR